MSTAQICQHCGKPIGAHAIGGLCPECLLKMGLGIGTEASIPGGTPSFRPPSIEELAPLFPQFEFLAFIGQGGMGAVYKARQKQLARTVALKILPPGIGDKPGFAERFTREAQAMARLNHPGIVTIHDFGQVQIPVPAPVPAAAQTPLTPIGSTPKAAAPTAPLYYLVMEFVDGVTLRQLLRVGRVSPREALAIVPQICDALQYAHDQGIVHRDIKPENILLDRQGRVKVADFGLAKLVGPDAAQESTVRAEAAGVPGGSPDAGAVHLTDPGHVMGTPRYMAPEQLAHPQAVDHRADIYSLGVTLYEMLTGEVPVGKFAPPSQTVQVDVRLDEVVLRALEKEPELRYQQAREVKTDLTAIAGAPSEPVSAPAANAAPPAADPVPGPTRRSRGLAALLAVTVLLLAMLGGLLLWPSKTSRGGKPAGCLADWRAANEGMDSVGTNNALHPGQIRLAQGEYGPAFDFQNSRQRILVPDAPAFHFGAGQDFSIEAWFQATPALTSFQLVTLVDKHHTPNTVSAVGFVLALWDGRPGCMLSDDLAPQHRTDYVSDGPDLRDNKLHHVALTVRRGAAPQGKLYADGREVLTFNPSGQLGDLSNSEPLRIGNHANPDLDCFFRGLIYEVALYKRALSPEEIRSLCAARPRPRLGADSVPTKEQAWDFSYGFKTIDDAEADRYVVGQRNVRKYSEWQNPPITYWGPSDNDAPATLTFRFDFAAPASGILLKAQLNSANKNDGSASGSCSLWGSTNGTSWELLLNDPQPFPGHFFQLYYNQPVPASLLGSASLWLQVRMQETGALPGVWAQAQFSRLDPAEPGNIFQLNVMERPQPRRADRILTPTRDAQVIGRPAAEAPEHRELLGTWELVGTKEAKAAEFTPVPKQRRQIKLITPYRFLWVEYDSTSGGVQAEAGGSYSLEGEVCTETTEFAKAGTARRPGDSAEYGVRIEGTNCYLSPNHGDRGRVEEWHRVAGVVPAAEESVRKDLVGAWEMTEWRPAKAASYRKTPTERRRVKFFTMTWAAWVEYDLGANVISMGCGGPYSAPDGFYHETLQFTDGYMRGFQGGHSRFKLKVEKDTLQQLALRKSNNDEIWERIRE
jgi:serine/threonine protein kinase